MKRLFFIVILLFSSSLSWAATYYVDAVAGNDASADPTNIATPWKTCTPVNTNVIAGDTVYFKKGATEFEQKFTGLVTIGGTDNTHRTTYASYGAAAYKPFFYSHSVVTDHITTGWTEDSLGIWKLTATSCNNSLVEDYKLLTPATSAALSDGEWYWDNGSQLIWYKPTGAGKTPAEHLVSKAPTTSINAGSFNNVMLGGLRISSGAIYGASQAALNVTIQNCDFWNCKTTALALGSSAIADSSNVLITHNTFSYCAQNIYMVTGAATSTYNTNCTISYNRISNSNTTFTGGRIISIGDMDGIAGQNMKNCVVEYNEISGNTDTCGISIWVGGAPIEVTGSVYRYNYIHDITGKGIVTSNGSGGQSSSIYGNIIVNFGTGPLPPGSYSGIKANSTQLSAAPSSIYNNTIVNGDIGIKIDVTVPDYWIIRNNIISNMSVAFVYNNEADGGNITLSNNNYNGGDTGTPFYYRNVAHNWNDWKVHYTETGSITTDPLFTNPTSGLATGFRLQATSPAKLAGTPVGLSTDYFGYPYHVTTPSMGAAQWWAYYSVMIGGMP